MPIDRVPGVPQAYLSSSAGEHTLRVTRDKNQRQQNTRHEFEEPEDAVELHETEEALTTNDSKDERIPSSDSDHHLDVKT